jgi:S-adenosylmethionine synthetase
MTKYTMATTFADILGLSSDCLVRKSDPPGPEETPRPRDCHLSNAVLASTGISVTEQHTFREWWTAYLHLENH